MILAVGIDGARVIGWRRQDTLVVGGYSVTILREVVR